MNISKTKASFEEFAKDLLSEHTVAINKVGGGVVGVCAEESDAYVFTNTVYEHTDTVVHIYKDDLTIGYMTIATKEDADGNKTAMVTDHNAGVAHLLPLED